MQTYPHHYNATASGTERGLVRVASFDLPAIETAPPPEFDGPGGVWSPETLLSAAVADCFILTFRGVSRAARLSWKKLECSVEGTLERVGNVTRFTRFKTRAVLTLESDSEREKAQKLLERAEQTCLVSNSLLGERSFSAEVIVETPAPAPV